MLSAPLLTRYGVYAFCRTKDTNRDTVVITAANRGWPDTRAPIITTRNFRARMTRLLSCTGGVPKPTTAQRGNNTALLTPNIQSHTHHEPCIGTSTPN